VTYAGGGGGGGANVGPGGSGGGGSGGVNGSVGGNGTVYGAAGGGGNGVNSTVGGTGFQGVVILKYPNTHDVNIGAGLIGDTQILSGFIDAFILAVTIVVVAIPEGLPLTIGVSLAFSVIRMYNYDKILVKNL
jgi:hypothetical protein